MLLIEAGRLEAVGREDHLRAAARARLLLCRAEETAADAHMALRCMHPEKPDFAYFSPGVTTETSDDVISRITKQEHEQARVTNPCGREVVLVDLLLQELKIPRLR